MKRETAPSSESAQFILAWRSEDSVESAKSSQSEAQPGIGCSAFPEAARSWRQQKARREGSIQRYAKLALRAASEKDTRGSKLDRLWQECKFMVISIRSDKRWRRIKRIVRRVNHADFYKRVQIKKRVYRRQSRREDVTVDKRGHRVLKTWKMGGWETEKDESPSGGVGK